MLSQEIKQAFDAVKLMVGDHGTLQALGVIWQAIEEAAGGVVGDAEAAAQAAEKAKNARIAALQAQADAAAKELAQLQPAQPASSGEEHARA